MTFKVGETVVYPHHGAALIEAIEEQQLLSDERERIGRELHDGAVQKVYTAGLLLQSRQY